MQQFLAIRGRYASAAYDPKNWTNWDCTSCVISKEHPEESIKDTQVVGEFNNEHFTAFVATNKNIKSIVIGLLN